jgi:rhodanese-related sulfurtransferase
MVVELYTEQIRDISVDDLKNRMYSGKGIFILDVRDLTTYCKGHIPGACDLFDANMSNMSPESIDVNASFIVYGPGQAQRSENPADRLSGDAIIKLMGMGFKNVMELRGGFEAWANAGNQVDRCEPQSLKPAEVPFTSRA